ncbi:MAG: hypothetical protein WB795_17810, partial [Candidatus Acidiferrales bacterium]
EMTELWKANTRLSTSPWKSRRRREISTFPQLRRRVVLMERKRNQKEKTEDRLHKNLDTAIAGRNQQENAERDVKARHHRQCRVLLFKPSTLQKLC